MPSPRKYNYPAPLSIIRFLLKAESIRKNPIPFHHHYFEALGDTFSIQIGPRKHVILSRDNAVAQHILQKNHRRYQKSELQTKFISKYLGHGLLTVNGDFWLRQRRMIQPAFHKQQMNQLVHTMQHIIVAELEGLPEERTVDLFAIMNQLAFNLVARSLFQLQTDEIKMNRLKVVISEVQDFLIKEIRVPYKSWWYAFTGQVARYKRMALESDAILLEIVEHRLRSKTRHNDLLDMLLDTRYEDTGQAMTTQQLIDEIKILFIAGHETTANALTFTLQLLANHPDAQQKVYDELVAIAATTTDPVEQLQKMTYTNAVINESMRLYPPAWITDRENVEADDLLEFHIKQKTLIGVSFYELHRNPKYWENPNDFVPERFLGEQRKQSLQYFYPFGAGPRMCIGFGFAMYEMGLALAHLVGKYEISNEDPGIRFNPLITLKPVGARVRFSRR